MYEHSCFTCGSVEQCIYVEDLAGAYVCQTCINDRFDEVKGKFYLTKETPRWNVVIYALQKYIDDLSTDLKKAVAYEDRWGDEDAVFLSVERDKATAVYYYLEGYVLTGTTYNRQDSHTAI